MIPRPRPLVLVTLPLLIGLLPALRFAPDPLPLLLLALLAALWALSAPLAPSPARPVPGSDLALLLAFTAAGAALGAVAVRDARADCRAWIADAARVELIGVLGAGVGFGAGEEGALLPLERAALAVSGERCEGTVRVRVTSDTLLRAGMVLRGVGEWVRTQPLAPPRWPAEPLYQGYVELDTVLAAERPDPLRHPLLWARGGAEARLARLFPARFGLAEALLLGRRERLDDEVRDRFVRAGLVHLLAISGAHVALFGAMLLLLGGALRVPRDRARLGTIAVTAAYLALIGAPGSAVRAGVMLSLVLLAQLMQRPSASLPIVAAAALAILAWSPRAALDPGVQLSFAGVGALMLAARVPYDRLPPAARRGVPRKLLEATVVSAVAFSLTAPVTAHHFGAVSPVAMPANLPAVPLTSLALVGVVSALAVDLVASPLAALLADGAALALRAVDAIARLAASVPYGYVGVTRPDWVGWAAVAAAAIGMARLLHASATPIRAAGATGAALAVALLWPALPRGAGGEPLRIHFLDVGQGDAIAIRTPGDRWILVDAGPRTETYDAGERRVLPFLRAQGASRVDLMVLTHPHADHIGGAPAVLAGMRVGAVMEPGVPAASALYRELLDSVERRGVRWIAAARDRRVTIDGVEIEVLWPEPGHAARVSDANEASAVLRLRYGEFAALLMGDAYVEAEREMIDREGAGLRAQLLKAGHHGSETSTSRELLEVARPELVVVSAGRRNRYGHPDAETMERLAERGIAVARTDLDGTVTVVVEPNGDWRRGAP